VISATDPGDRVLDDHDVRVLENDHEGLELDSQHV
jgi:hypothetical protein